MLDSLHQIDNQLLLQINGESTPFWDCFMWTVSAKETWIILYVSLLYVLIRNFSWRTTLVMFFTIVLTIVFTDQVCSTLIRPFAERLRPSNPDNPISSYVYIVNEYRGGKYGLPSCHSANTFGLAFMFILLIRNKLLSFSLIAWACLNCYSRMHLGVHYPGDLLCGMLVALVGATLIYRLMLRVFKIEKFRLAVGITDHDNNLVTRNEGFRICMVPTATLLLIIVAIALFAQFLQTYI